MAIQVSLKALGFGSHAIGTDHAAQECIFALYTNDRLSLRLCMHFLAVCISFNLHRRLLRRKQSV